MPNIPILYRAIFWIIDHIYNFPQWDNISFLSRFLHEVTEHSDKNKMSANNLAIIITPNVIWSNTAVQVCKLSRLLMASYVIFIGYFTGFLRAFLFTLVINVNKSWTAQYALDLIISICSILNICLGRHGCRCWRCSSTGHRAHHIPAHMVLPGNHRASRPVFKEQAFFWFVASEFELKQCIYFSKNRL